MMIIIKLMIEIDFALLFFFSLLFEGFSKKETKQTVNGPTKMLESLN